MLQTETWCRTCLGWRLSRHFVCGCLPQPPALIDELASLCSLELFLFRRTCLSSAHHSIPLGQQLISRSRKQSLPLFACKNAVHRWFSRQPSAVRSKVQIVNEWPDRSSSRRSPSYPPFALFFFLLCIAEQGTYVSSAHYDVATCFACSVFSCHMLWKAWLPREVLPAWICCA